jgi:hypothetical protein
MHHLSKWTLQGFLAFAMAKAKQWPSGFAI